MPPSSATNSRGVPGAPVMLAGATNLSRGKARSVRYAGGASGVPVRREVVQVVPYRPSDGWINVRLMLQQVRHYGLDVLGGERVKQVHELL